jgi:adenosine deaminase
MPPASLLISLGTSPAIVPEAFHLPGVSFTAVHVLTTETTSVDLIHDYFASEAPDVRLTITRVAGFKDLRTEEDHHLFEEVLCRWMLASEPDPDRRYISLSGGYKTISASVQKTAGLFGARQVFHVLADNLPAGPGEQGRPPRTPDEIRHARDIGALRYVPLGPEPGWPQLAQARAADYPLSRDPIASDGTHSVTSPDRALTARIADILDRSHRIARGWDSLAELPFAELVLWSPQDLAWLSEPLDPIHDAAWVRSLPKIDLHCHLGGFATHGTDLDLVRQDPNPALPPRLDLPFPPGWPLPSKPCGLEDYMKLGNNNGSKLLRDPDCLRRQCRLLYERLIQDNVVYAEIRCSPNNYAGDGRSAFDVLNDIRSHFQECMSEHPDPTGRPRCHVNLLIIATRKNSGDRSDISRHLSLAITAADQWRDEFRCRVVGVDLAGFESPTTRAALFQTDFEAVHRVGLAVTVHAGENDDAEGIWQAVFKLNALRLGHALHLYQAPDLLQAVADRAVAIEMCPYANVQIRGFKPINSKTPYPLQRYLDADVRVTVNTDNLGISAATLSDNLLLLAQLCPGLTRRHLLQLQRNAVEEAFVGNKLRAELRRRTVPPTPTATRS